MKRKTDSIWLGLGLGIFVPFLVMFIFYLSSYAYLTVPDFLRKMVFAAIFFKVLSLCAIVNLLTFFLFYKTQNDRAAKGVILATFLFAFAVVINQLTGQSL
jgi:hypothetical protein